MLGGKRSRYFIFFGIICIGISLFLANDAIQANEKYETLSSTLYVGGTGTGNYSRIQHAIDNASNGDTIFVYNGTYYENVVINKSISLIGEDRNATIIDGNGAGAVLHIKVDYVNISNFSITNSSSGTSGIYIHSDNNIIYNLNVYMNGDAIYLASGSNNNTIYNSNFYLNNRHGICIVNSSYNTLYGLNIYSNNYDGIRLYYTSNNNVISSCNILNNTNHGIHIQYLCNNNTIRCCNICNNSYGIHITQTSNNNIIFHNDFVNNTIQAHDECSNTWDNSYSSGGNYWDDFDEPIEGAYDNDSDGIIDSPYNIPGGSNKDNYPLANSIFASVPFVENFSATVPPAGWVDSHSAWESSNTNYSGGAMPEARLPYYNAVDGCKLYTCPIDTKGYNRLILRFKTYVNHYTGTNKYTLHVMTSVDTINWKDVWNITLSANYGPSTETILLSSEDSIGSFLYIAFVITGDPWYINYWYIDDVELLPLPTIVYVDDDFNSGTPGWNYTHFNKIQNGINGVAENGTVYVYNGTYYENVVINKSISLIGEDRNTVIIDGNNTGDVVYVTANNVSIRNFTIRNSGNNWRDSGIKIRSSFNHISGCNILDCYDGIYTHFSYSSNNTISSCNIYLNNIGIELVYFSDYNNISYCQLHLNGIGIDITNSHYNTIFNCHIHSNNGTGIWNGYSDNTTIFQSYIHSNNGTGIWNGYSDNTTIFQSYIHSNNGTGIWNGYSDNTTIFQSYIHSNNGTGIWNGYSEGNIIYWNTISNNSYGIYAVFSYNNKIFHNNFINNTVQAYDNGNNTWDNGYPMGGNYWSNFTSPDNKHGYYQNLSGFDLLVDYPYNISGGSNKDRWPHTIKDGWMKPLFVPNIILVEFKQNVSNSTINATIANYGTEVIEYLKYVNVYLLNITADNQSEFDTYYMFNNDTNVLWACLDLYEYLAAKPEHLTTPNDPCYPKQWHLNNYGINPGVPTGLIDADIDAPQAWEHLTDCRKDWNNSDFVIAIIDSGVDLNHPDIVANLWTNPNEQIGDANGDGFPGVKGVDDDGDGLTDFDDYHRILARETNIDEDDDEDGIVNEDPVNGIDDDGDGRKDEDPPGDANGDGFPGVKGVDDDGDGKADYNDNNYLAFIRANYQFHNDDDENGVVDDIHGADFVDMDGSPDDENGHGTHCAGIICAHGNNGIGVTGVCWRAQLMVLRTFDASGRTSFSSFEKCIDYVIWAKNHSVNVKVVSYSGGGSGNAIPKQNAINKLHKKKILFVCAAGNDGRDLDDPANPWDFYPAECTNPNIIAVAASDNQDRLVTRANWGWGSNWGTTSVDIVAPGQHIFSLGLSQRYNQPEGIYRDINNIGIVSADDIRLSSLPTYGTGPVGANDADVGLPLILFNPDEKHTVLEPDNGQYDPGEIIYKDIVNPANNRVDVGDIRLTSFRAGGILYRAGSVVRIWDPDVGLQLQGFNSDEKHTIYCYKSGTSMATPMVTGEVAHFWCQFPNLNHLQVKEWILKKVDPRASLQNTVVSGINHDGRLRMISGFDFGDAPDPFKGVNHRYPTVLDDDNGTGASHEDIGEEWLGWDVSPEYDANVNATPPYDVDGTPNLWPPRVPPNPHPPYAPGDIPDLDVHDDGVFLPMVVFRGGVFPIEFHIQTENPFIDDADSGRYDEFRAVKRDEKKIYINAFFDWNNDGDWDDINEPLIKCPALVCTWWGGPNMTCCYGIFWPSWQWLTNIFPFLQPLVNLLNENAYRRTTFTVPWNAELGETWVRVRLDYGENAGLPPYPRYDSDFPFATPLIDTYRHAQFGEVEDYWLYIINKTKVVGEPKYYDGEITWVTSYTPIQIIDEPEPPYPVFNYYRLWYGEWSPWIEYNDTFYLEGEGLHYIEYYGKVVENNKTIFYDGFNDDSRWVAIDLDGFAYTWEWTNITPEWINGTFEGYFMLFDQYAVGELEIPNHDSLISAPISCSMFNNTMLYFDGMFNTTGNEKLWINVSTISGEYMQWTNVLTLEENSSGPWLINISSIADGNIIAINFTYSSPYGTGYGALIDNVYIYGDVITYSPVYNQSHIVDDTPPTAIINAITPYNQTSIPFEITYNASDDACGLKEVWLYFRYSYDNSTWSDWLPYAKSNNGEWIFHAPYAPAYYEFYSMAVDNLGNAEAYDGIEAMAYVPLQTFAFELKEGWNLITLPCINGYNASSLYADINGCSIILSWNASMQDFIIYVPGSPYDFEIEDGHGYFIGMKYDTYFALIYDPIEYVSIPLVVGWNILGWFKENETTASSLLENILGCNIVLKWNASMQDFDLYAPGVPDDFVIKRGDGFLVAVDEESEWHGEG